MASVELTFLKTLSKEAYEAYMVAKKLRDNPGMKIGKAGFNAGYGGKWNAEKLERGLEKVAKALEQTGGTGGDFDDVWEIMKTGVDAIETAKTAAETASTGGAITRGLTALGRRASQTAVIKWILKKLGRDAALSAGAAMGLGTAVLVLTLAPFLYWGAGYLGSRSGDEPVQPGWAMSQVPSTPVVVSAGSNPGEAQAVFVLQDIPSVYVGQESVLKANRTCDMPFGGQCTDPNVVYPPVNYQKVSADFGTYEEARAAFCANFTIENGAWGAKAVGNGGKYWLPTGLGCP